MRGKIVLEDMIKIIKLNKTALHAYIHSAYFKTSPVIPISYHRALSQIINPVVKDDDNLLFLAYFDEILVGYLGVLPDDIYHENGLSTHIGWMSCLWVDPNHRGKKIAQTLIHACFEAWSGRILLTEFTSEAASLYKKMGLFQLFNSHIGKRWPITAQSPARQTSASDGDNERASRLKQARGAKRSALAATSVFAR